jgi:hypothetical protein
VEEFYGQARVRLVSVMELNHKFAVDSVVILIFSRIQDIALKLKDAIADQFAISTETPFYRSKESPIHVSRKRYWCLFVQ